MINVFLESHNLYIYSCLCKACFKALKVVFKGFHNSHTILMSFFNLYVFSFSEQQKSSHYSIWMFCNGVLKYQKSSYEAKVIKIPKAKLRRMIRNLKRKRVLTNS